MVVARPDITDIEPQPELETAATILVVVADPVQTAAPIDCSNSYSARLAAALVGDRVECSRAAQAQSPTEA